MGAAISGLCLAVQALCCACSCFKCLCSSALGDHGVKPWQAKLYYVMFLAAGTLISFLVGKFGEDKVEQDITVLDIEIFTLTVSCEDITGQQVCSGDSAVLRASFASVLFFGVCFLGTINVPTFSGDKSWRPLLGEGFHNGWWIFKILIYFALLIGSFFMKFFDDDTYTGVARFVSMIFLALQVLVLIDFAYVWNESWLERSGIEDDFSDGSKLWLYALLAITGILYLTTFGGLITILIFYKGCTDTIAFAVVNLILVIIFIVITVFRESIVGEQASIAPAAIVSAYTVFLTWSASQSNPNVSDECDPFDLQLGKNKAEIFIGLAIGTLTLVWTAFSVSQNSKSLLEGTGEATERPGVTGAYEIQEADGTTKYAADAAPSQNVGEAADETGSDERLWVFHAIMITASFYMAMSLTNWGVKEQDVEINGSQVGLISMYVKMAANWAASLLFIWTLIAPAILPDRDF